MKQRLLITARDVAAALHLIEIAKIAMQHPEFSVEIVTQMPATRYFQNAGISTHIIDLPPAKEINSKEGAALLEAAHEILAETQPDAVLCGLSTPFDGGIDEAVIASFTGPSFVMQDFWGEANLTFGKPADLYLALDDEGVRLSAERHGVQAVVVGSPRHSAYSEIDIHAIRKNERERLGISADNIVIGFFGQALHSLQGYRRMLQEWIEAIHTQDNNCMALYRPHPREQENEKQWTFDCLVESGIRCIMSDAQDVEHSLLVCDVVCSAFSNCTYDAAYLNYFSDRPLITPVSMLFDQEIIDYFRRVVRLAEFPYLRAGLVKVVRKADDLAMSLAEAATDSAKHHYWQIARNKLHDPTTSASQVLSQIFAITGKKSIKLM